MNESSLKKLIDLGSDISIVDIALKINKKIHPGLMHDATEGGVLGAVYETISPSNFGINLYSEKFPLTEETIKVCETLDVDPLKVISSGTLLVITSKSKAHSNIDKKSSKILPKSIIYMLHKGKNLNYRLILTCMLPLRMSLWVWGETIRQQL